MQSLYHFFAKFRFPLKFFESYFFSKEFTAHGFLLPKALSVCESGSGFKYLFILCLVRLQPDPTKSYFDKFSPNSANIPPDFATFRQISQLFAKFCCFPPDSVKKSHFRQISPCFASGSPYFASLRSYSAKFCHFSPFQRQISSYFVIFCQILSHFIIFLL